MCFSPPVMLATFVLEFGLLFYTLWRYQLTTMTRLATVFLGCLGTFQLAEYMICGGLGLGHAEWVKLGYVAITFLPALGLHMTATIANVSVKPLLFAAYGTAAAFAVFFVTASNGVNIHECAPNYTVFDMTKTTTFIYGMFYYGWLLLTVGLGTYWAKKKPEHTMTLRWMVASYAVFIVPTTIANMIDPATLGAIPSIMCGLAVICALILVGRVLPLAKIPYRNANTKSSHQNA